jgi:hypothetical protein
MQAAVGDPEIDYAAIDDRQILAAVFNQAGIGNSTGTDLKVSQRGAGADFSVDVAPGLAIVGGGDVTGQGFYVIQSNAVENVTVPPPPASGSRTHRMVAQVQDKLHNSTDWSTYDWAPMLLEDTGSGTPALPASAIDLGLVAVAAAQSSVTDSDITDKRRSAVFMSAGTGRFVASDAGRPAVPWEGEQIWRSDQKHIEVYDGSAWRVLGPPAPTQVESATAISAFTNTGYQAGSTACGDTFTAPSTGRVYVTVSGRVSSALNGEQAFLSYEIRTGTSVGSGTEVQATSDNRALVTSRAVNTGAAAYAAGSRRVLVTGLTGGADYNIRTMHKVTGGQGTVDFRALLIEPA